MSDNVQDIVSQIRSISDRQVEEEGSRGYLVALEGENSLAFPVSSLVETIQPDREQGIIKIPLSEPYILGVVNVRGEMLPVLSFNRIIGTEAGTPKYLIVVKDVFQVAFAFDSLVEIVEISNSSHSPLINIEERPHDVFLKEEFDFEGRTVRVVDISSLFKSSFLV